MEGTIDKYAKIIWDYMHVGHKLSKADLIFVLGSNDLRVADRAAELYEAGLAPLIVCSGGNGKRSDFNRSEADLFSEKIISLGVPKEKIILESNSSNTGENTLFTQKLLKDKNILVKKIIAVQKPYMERRTLATINKQWAEIECIVTSPQLSYEEYFDGDLSYRDRFVNVMVGDLLRIKEYPKLGFQTYQEIPDKVWQAGQELIKMGYNEYVI